MCRVSTVALGHVVNPCLSVCPRVALGHVVNVVRRGYVGQSTGAADVTRGDRLRLPARHISHIFITFLCTVHSEKNPETVVLFTSLSNTVWRLFTLVSVHTQQNGRQSQRSHRASNVVVKPIVVLIVEIRVESKFRKL